MKEATGELNMTVIVVIAIAAVATIFTTVILPSIQTSIAKKTCEQGGGTYTAGSNGSAGTCTY